MKDVEYMLQGRLADRIGQYHKHVDNVMVSNPDPKSSHFLRDDNRFQRDFASDEKARKESVLMR